MTRTDNSSFLAQANARRHQAALSAARHAIEQLQRQGKPVNFSAIAQSAGVSRGWLYRQDQIRDTIGRLRRLDPPAARVTAQRASAESLRQRLDAARSEITRLRAENHSLREQIARHIGLQRTGSQTQPSRDEPATTSPNGPGGDMSTPPEIYRHRRGADAQFGAVTACVVRKDRYGSTLVAAGNAGAWPELNCSLSKNFWTLPDPVSGKASVNTQWRGVLWAARCARQ